MTHSLKFTLLNFLMKDLRALQRHGNARADVPCADMLFKFGLMHQAGGLLARSAQNEAAAGVVHRIRQLFEGLQSGGVDGRHVAQSQHNDGRQRRNLADHFFDLIGGAKKKWSVDAEDGHVRRNFLVLQDVHLAFA